MKNKICIAFIIVVITIIIGTSVAFALTYNIVKEIPASVDIISEESRVEVYSDSTCTKTLTSLYFGEVKIPPPGIVVKVDETIYVKNVGTEKIDIWVSPLWLWSCSVTSSQTYGRLSLLPSEVGSFTIILNISDNIPIGKQTFLLRICEDEK